MQIESNKLSSVSEMKRRSILSRCTQEAQDSVVGRTGGEIDSEQAKGFRYYFGFRRGDEEENLAAYVSRLGMEAVDPILADVMRAIWRQDRLLDFKPTDSMDAAQARQASLAVESVLRDQQIEARKVLYDFVKNGLIAKLGVIRADPYTPPPEPFTQLNINLFTLLMLHQDEMIEIVEISAEQVQPDEFYPNGMMYHIHGRRKQKPGLYLLSVKPENMLIPKYCRTLDQRNPIEGTQYCGYFDYYPESWFREMFPDQKETLNRIFMDEESSGTAGQYPSAYDSDTSRERHADEEIGYVYNINDNTGDSGASGGNRWRRFYDEYVRFDLDGDGIAELLNIKRIEDDILYIAEVADNPFAWFTPHPVPNKLIGESTMDKVMDIQDATTDFMRAAMNAVAFGINPRLMIDARATGGGIGFADTQSDLQQGGIGAMVRIAGLPREVVQPLPIDSTPAQQAIGMLEVLQDDFGRRLGSVSPVMRGSDTNTYNRSATGQHLAMQRGQVPTEEIAEQVAAGLRILARKTLRLLCTIGEEKMQVRDGSSTIPINPAYWDIDADCSIHIGGAILNRDQRLNFLFTIQEMQQGIIKEMGVTNPICNMKKYAQTLNEIGETMGFPGNMFFDTIDDQQQQQIAEQMSEKKDPDIEKAQIKAQSDQEIANIKILSAERIQQIKTRADMLQGEMKMRAENEIKMLELMLQMRQMMIEAGMDTRQMNIEAKIELLRIQVENDIARTKMKVDREMKKSDQNISRPVAMGGDKTG